MYVSRAKQHNIRRGVVAGLAATATLTGAYFGANSKPEDAPKPSMATRVQRYLGQVPTERITVRTFEGEDAVIARVQPGVLANPLLKAAETRFIDKQLLPGHSSLQTGQTVDVPIVQLDPATNKLAVDLEKPPVPQVLNTQ